ncbi:beta-galactosidase [Qipengyuania vesicularis]|uniref:beta-galactosidase n=1 Tax=Qipengyuania vesicularis TaxID=2867232 RepID=UPI001C86ACE6|nr:beta-galactosidase [Qipengyuania vesicularis]MBX7527702.1 beta-galactosidase [Qipengyuania vesicularis]
MHLGVCYYPEHWPEERWAEDARLMRETGLTRVRIGEFAWSRIEPEPGRFDWGWLDRAVEVLHEAGLGIIMGTPTATPPKWLVDRMPDMVAIDREGRPRGFGSRRHYCFSHMGYREEAQRITRVVAERYGEHPGVVSWQTDNEYGCHDTVQSFSPAARDAFRRWLANRYGSIEALNEAWGNVFWSMEYRSFDEIDLPNLTVTEANPAHWLAFRRFSSDQVIAFNRGQVEILREHSPGRDITHNAMGFYTGYDHHDLGAEVDVLGWDSYPLGFLEMFCFSEEEKRAYARQGHPDIAAFHHDLYRGCAKDGRWSVLEQQPGPVNWARYNPAPLPGMVKLWTLEAFAHGAEMVSYFRWRQFPKAQEQMHAGLLRPDGNPAPALAEARAVADCIGEIESDAPTPKQAALVFSYESEWITQIQPQGEGRSGLWAAFSAYSAMRELGLDIDILPPGADLAGYRLVVVPCLPIVPDALARSLENIDGQIIIGPRTGSRTTDFAIPENLPPGPLEGMAGGTITLSESLRSGVTIEGDGWSGGGWFDHFEGSADAEMTAKDGRVVLWRKDKARLLAVWPEGSVLCEAVRRAARDAGLPHEPLPEGRRRRRRGNNRFEFDYLTGQASWSTVES